MNTMTAAADLLARMMMVNSDPITRPYIKDNLNRFQSAIVFQALIDRDMIAGHTNHEVYDLYSNVAKDMNIDPLGDIDFSRTICKYYGFEVHSEKKGGRTRRVFRLVDTPAQGKAAFHAQLCQVLYVTQVKDKEDFIGKTNSESFEEYQSWCRDNCQPMGNKINFSRLVASTHDLQPKSVRRNGTLVRIYEEVDGDDYGDNSPGQASVGC